MHSHCTLMDPKDSEEPLRNDIVRHVCATQCVFNCHCDTHPLLCCARVLSRKSMEMEAHPRVSQIVSSDSAVNAEITSFHSVSVHHPSLHVVYNALHLIPGALLWLCALQLPSSSTECEILKKSEMLRTWSTESANIPTTAQISCGRTPSPD